MGKVMNREKTTKPFTLANLDYLHKQKRLWLNPSYQRESVWSRSQKQLLIDSILTDVDIPKLYFRTVAKDTYQYEVVDGQQRLRAIFEFFADSFPLPEDSDPAEGHATAGRNMKDLHTDLQMKLRDAQLDVCVLQSGYDDDDIEEIFLRLQNGTPLNAAEKRRALPGDMRNVVEQLAAHPFFTSSLCGFTGKRYAYEDAVAKLLHLFIEKKITDIKHSSIKRTYENNQNIKLTDPAVVRLKNSLNFAVKAFSGLPNPKFKKFAVITAVNLIAEMRDTYSISSAHTAFGKAYLQFEEERLLNEELDEEKKDTTLSAYTSAARADRVQDLTFRHDTLRRRIVSMMPELERKDEERFFSQDQRQAIYLRAKGLCGDCGTFCDESSFHADHIKPHSKGGLTKISNGQLLCPSCNSSKGSS
jgi:hypothetical protein